MSRKSIFTISQIEKTDSTSAEIKRRMDGLENFTVISAFEQTEGRGQGDHVWHSRPGENLTFSIYIKYDSDTRLKASEQQILTKAASLSVTDFLNSEFSIVAGIKKPNDIYVGGEKICGMLIENGLQEEHMRWSIVGMGINVNQNDFPADIPNPVSISRLTGRRYDTGKCLESFLRYFAVRYDAIWSDRCSLDTGYEEKIISLKR